MKGYNVLWIDDEWDKMSLFKEECEAIHNIVLWPFKTQREGIEELERNIKFYDAVLLDAKMFDQSENEVAKLTGLRKAIDKINQLAIRKRLPYFISTGQPDLMGNDVFQESFGHFYIKERDDLRLFEDIKNAIDNSEYRQIRCNYDEALSALEALDKRSVDAVMDVLVSMHYPHNHPDFSPLLYYNPFRKVLEYIFRACNQHGILPDVCFGRGEVNLNQCFMYLIGGDAKILHIRYGNAGERVVPRHIQDIMSLILNLGNSNSHTVELSPGEIEDVQRNIGDSKLLIYSMALQICELGLWFSQYISMHPDKEKNLSMCKSLEQNNTDIEKPDDKEHSNGEDNIRGVVEQTTTPNGVVYHIGGKYVVNTKFAEDNKLLGENVIVTKVTENTNPKTKNQYPFYANYTKKITK